MEIGLSCSSGCTFSAPDSRKERSNLLEAALALARHRAAIRIGLAEVRAIAAGHAVEALNSSHERSRLDAREAIGDRRAALAGVLRAAAGVGWWRSIVAAAAAGDDHARCDRKEHQPSDAS